MLLDEATLERVMAEHLLPEEAERFRRHTRTSARLVPIGDGDPPGAVLGGGPLLPDDIDWPRWEGEPLDFVASVDLAALSNAVPGLPLPGRGVLLFFMASVLFGADGRPVGAFEPDSRLGWSVLSVPSGASVRPRARPPGGLGRIRRPYRQVPMSFALETTCPEGVFLGEIDGVDPKRRAVLEDALDELLHGSRRMPNHRVGGWPQPTQPEPALWVTLADAGLIGGDDPLDWEDPAVQQLSGAANEDWFLLLQLDSDDGPSGPGWMWEDGGVVFFYVRPEQAIDGDFSNVWMTWDCM